YRDALKALDDERQKLEEQLSRRSAEFSAEQQLVSLDKVAQAIPPGAALLEIYRYDPYKPKARRAPAGATPPRHAAYLLRPHGDPSFADLGEVAPIDDAVKKLQAALKDRDQTHDPKPAARGVDELIMRPIRALLGDTRWVLLSPDGALNLIPFEALVDE